MANLKLMGGEVLEAAPGLTLMETLELKLQQAGLICRALGQRPGTGQAAVTERAAVGRPDLESRHEAGL